MTRQKSFKSRVRARMGKTGESYTTARRQLLAKTEPSADQADTPEVTATEELTPQAQDVRAAAGEGVRAHAAQLSEDAVLERTGRTRPGWFALLDAWGATQRTHTEIARWLVAEHQVDGWWAQSVTVAYEQARRMRAPGQRADGLFSATASKTLAASAERVFAAFADAGLREEWLPGASLRVRTATAPKSLRADWAEGSSRLVVAVTTKGEGKAQVALEHEKLADAEAAARMKMYWRERLAVLKGLLED